MQQSTACLHVRGAQRRCVWAVGRLGVAACLACVAAAAVDRQARRCELASTRRSVGLCDLESVAALTDQPGMQKRSDSGDDRETARLPWGRNFCPHTHPIPIPMGIRIRTADVGNSGRIGDVEEKALRSVRQTAIDQHSAGNNASEQCIVPAAAKYLSLSCSPAVISSSNVSSVFKPRRCRCKWVHAIKRRHTIIIFTRRVT